MIPLHLLLTHFFFFFFFCSKTSHKKLLDMLFPTSVLSLSLKFTPSRPSSLQSRAKMCLINVFPHLYQVKSKEQHQVLILFGQSAAPGIVGDSFFKGFKEYIYLAAQGCNCDMQDLHCVLWDLLLWHADCPTAYGTLFPQWGAKLTFPALQGIFLTTGPSEKSRLMSPWCSFFT